ncbi:MAG: nicotinate-nucleotide adenylyltransferase [Synechococcaceae cyanobacterium]
MTAELEPSRNQGHAVPDAVDQPPPAAALEPGPGASTPSGPVALFGTSADPPTLGHRALLQGLRGQYPLVATWASDNPMKRHTAPLALRQRLLEAVVRAIADPDVRCVQELSSPWAVETLERAGKRWPDRPLVFVIGSDLAPQLPSWREAPRLLASCRLAIAPRQGWDLAPADLERLRQLGAVLEVLPLRIPATASSALRAPSAAADPRQLPAELWPLLVDQNPYGLLPP